MKLVCSSKAILKWRSQEIPELDYFSKWVRQNWTERGDRSSSSNIHIVSGKFVASLDLFSQEGEEIYARSFTSKSTMLVMREEVNFDITEWAASSETGAMTENVHNQVSINSVLKAHPRKSLLATCSTRKQTVLDVLFWQLW